MKILIVEDEEKMRNSLAEGLRLKGYAIDVAGDGESADEKAFYERYDLIILDLNLPKLDGFSVLENFRKENLDVPVLILSARDGIEDKVKGLDLGANDYLTKPFHFAELEARVRSLLRRKTVIENTVLSSGSLCFDTASRIVTAAGHPVSLTTKENALLEYLLLHKGRVIKLEELIEHVWDSNADPFSNSVRVHMSSLRRKLKAQFIVVIALTISGMLLMKLARMRSGEIGLLMALGYHRGQIQKMLLWESLLLSSLSALTTTLFALLLTTLSGILPVHIAPLQFAGSICGTVLLVWFITAIANAKLLRTDPAKALRE